jgi:molybdopterin converting factor small subunit
VESQPVIIVHVKLLGFLAQLDGQTELELRIEPGATLVDVIYLVAERLGPDFRRTLLDRHGNLHGGMEVLLDRQHVSARKISEITLWDDSHLVIMPLVGGGQGSDTPLKEEDHVSRWIQEQKAQNQSEHTAVFR